LRANTHGITHLIVEHGGRRSSAVERAVNTGGVELGGRLLGPWDLVVRACRRVDDLSGGDVGVEVAGYVDVRDALRVSVRAVRTADRAGVGQADRDPQRAAVGQADV